MDRIDTISSASRTPLAADLFLILRLNMFCLCERLKFPNMFRYDMRNNARGTINKHAKSSISSSRSPKVTLSTFMPQKPRSISMQALAVGRLFYVRVLVLCLLWLPWVWCSSKEVAEILKPLLQQITNTSDLSIQQKYCTKRIALELATEWMLGV